MRQHRRGEGEETSGSENETRLVAAGPLGGEPGGLQAARLSVLSHAGLEAAAGDDLSLGPDSDGERAGSVAQNGVGAIVEWLERWDDAATTDSDKGGGEELGWQLAG